MNRSPRARPRTLSFRANESSIRASSASIWRAPSGNRVSYSDNVVSAPKKSRASIERRARSTSTSSSERDTRNAEGAGVEDAPTGDGAEPPLALRTAIGGGRVGKDATSTTTISADAAGGTSGDKNARADEVVATGAAGFAGGGMLGVGPKSAIAAPPTMPMQPRTETSAVSFIVMVVETSELEGVADAFGVIALTPADTSSPSAPRARAAPSAGSRSRDADRRSPISNADELPVSTSLDGSVIVASPSARVAARGERRRL